MRHFRLVAVFALLLCSCESKYKEAILDSWYPSKEGSENGHWAEITFSREGDAMVRTKSGGGMYMVYEWRYALEGDEVRLYKGSIKNTEVAHISKDGNGFKLQFVDSQVVYRKSPPEN